MTDSEHDARRLRAARLLAKVKRADYPELPFEQLVRSILEQAEREQNDVKS